MKTLAIAVIVLLFTQTILSSAALAAASCSNTCDGYRKAVGAATDPTFSARYGQIGQLCDANELLDKSDSGTKGVMIAYTASAVGCGAACGAKYARDAATAAASASITALNAPYTALGACAMAVTDPPLFEMATSCKGLLGLLSPYRASVIAAAGKYNVASKMLSATDASHQLDRVAAIQEFKATSAELVMALETESNQVAVGTNAACPVCGLSAAMAYTGALQASANTVSLASTAAIGTEAAMAACEVTGLTAGVMDLIKATELKQGNVSKYIAGTAAIGASAIQATGYGNQYVGPCVTAGIMSLAALLRKKSMMSYDDSIKQNCTTITQLAASGAAANAAAFSFALNPPQAANMTATTGSSAQSGLSGLNLGGSGPFPGTLMGTSAAATADPFAKMFDRMPNKSKIPEVLQKLGTSVAAIGGRLDSGESPSSIVGSLPNLAPGLSDELKRMNMAFMGGGLQLNETSAIASGGGGGHMSGGAKGGMDFGGLAGMFGGPTQAQPTVTGNSLAFGRSPASADIWHENFKGSIFEIVSQKLGSTKDRVEQLGWATPLNRALTK